MSKRTLLFVGVLTFAILTGGAAPASAQGVEVAPFGGYRFGGDIFEDIAGRNLDADGAPAFGIVLDVPLSDGLQVEGVFSHQHADIVAPLVVRPISSQVVAPPGSGAGLQHWRITVDQWQAGGLQEFGGTEFVRP